MTRFDVMCVFFAAGDLTANNILLVDAAEDDIRNFSAKVPKPPQSTAHGSETELSETLPDSRCCYSGLASLASCRRCWQRIARAAKTRRVVAGV